MDNDGSALQEADGPTRRRPPVASATRTPQPQPRAQVQAQAQPGRPRVQQPTPQALPTRQGPGSILVSPRQKGNPILNNIQSVPWEYSDIPADYVLGATSCALFLSLKYHRLHPEYIYSRIRGVAGKYRLRVLMVMVDIDSHEDPLKELSKTSLINNLTLMLCWSAAEAGRYLSLYKSYEHAPPSSIRGQQATSYSEKLVEFVTAPKSINKTDTISLVGNFGSLRSAINAQPEEIALLGGWGDKKVSSWHSAVREGFRVRKAQKRGVTPGLRRHPIGDALGAVDDDEEVILVDEDQEVDASRRIVATGGAPTRPVRSGTMPSDVNELEMELHHSDPDEEEALQASLLEQEQRRREPTKARPRPVSHIRSGEGGGGGGDEVDDQSKRSGKSPASAPAAKEDNATGMNDGILAALARLRENAGAT